MVRRYADPVEVKAKQDQGPGDEVPDSFLWRGRLYVVRAVLGHWRERRAWWNESAARAVHGEVEASPASGVTPSRASSQTSGWGSEQEVWRVEASAGRRAGTGVYDLCRSPLSTWSLVCVAD